MRYYPPRYLFRAAEILRRVEGGHSFCEVGAGDLTLSSDLLDHFAGGVAIDLVDDLVGFHQRLRPSKRDALEVCVGDLDQLSLNRHFSAIVTCEVMEHVPDDAAFLASIFRHLEPGGQLLLSVPARMKHWTFHDDLVGHVRRYERTDLINLLRSAGFVGIDVAAYGFPFVNLLRWPRLLLARRQRAPLESLDSAARTAQSNHRQIPESLSSSPVRFLTQPALFAPFIAISRLFHGLDLSDGYVVEAWKPS